LAGQVENVEPLVAMGTPHVEIVRLAEEQGADLIVIATHGRGFISHAILGSTAERVLRRSPCPVLVVRDPAAGD
jgi:nucleotide-binding universal stress UspA family protein